MPEAAESTPTVRAPGSATPAPGAPAGAPARRTHLVIGTAGHIDHGKTALVRALTGEDTDRLPEEKARGITIELGFASMTLADGTQAAVVDVPGHERFVRTMVSGAFGIDLVLLVVAADEGVMPQTREHLAICRLLGVEHGVVVLNKCDQADAEMRELAAEEVRDALAGGPLADAPIVAASALTGEGIDTLRAALAAVVAKLPPRREDTRPARLFVDRVFEKRGFGAIVTGTWSGRGLAVGQTVVLEPGDRRARIRGLERHGERIEAALSGARIAVNLQGQAENAIHRGDLVCEPDALLATACFDAELEWLADGEALAEPTAVELLSGTAERRARVAPIGEAPIARGARGFARIHVDGPPLHLLPGDRFVVRGFARDAGVGGTLGGGRVLDVDPPHRRRSDPLLTAELVRLAAGARSGTGSSTGSSSQASADDEASRDDALLVRVERAGLAGTTTARLARETGLAAADLAAGLGRLERAGSLVRLGPERCLASAAAGRLRQILEQALDAYHAEDPLQPGMPRATLQGRVPENVPSELAAAVVSSLADSGFLTIEDQLVRRTDFRPRLDADQERLAAELLRRIDAAGLEAPALKSLADELGAPLARLRAMAHHLEREGRLVAAPEELFFARPHVDDLIARVVARFADSAELDTQTLKNLIGASRRTAMPLMALLDELQITRRDGSLRRLLHREPRFARSRARS